MCFYKTLNDLRHSRVIFSTFGEAGPTLAEDKDEGLRRKGRKYLTFWSLSGRSNAVILRRTESRGLSLHQGRLPD